MPESDRPQRTVELPTVIVVCIVLIMVILFIAQVAVGAIYQDDCPRQPFIPIYLYGFVAIFFLVFWCDMCNMDCCCLTAVFFFCWFIAGSVTIYSIYEPNYNKNTTQADPYCNKTLYLFAFWSTTITYVLLGVILLSCCCCKQQKQDDDAQINLN